VENSPPTTIAFADFDTDGHPEALVYNRESINTSGTETRVEIWSGRSEGKLTLYGPTAGWVIFAAVQEKIEGNPSYYADFRDRGVDNGFGWRLQGFIENKAGDLRTNTYEETLFCMGYHSTIGTTIDKVLLRGRHAGRVWSRRGGGTNPTSQCFFRASTGRLPPLAPEHRYRWDIRLAW